LGDIVNLFGSRADLQHRITWSRTLVDANSPLVVLPLVQPVINAQAQFGVRRRIAAQLVPNDRARAAMTPELLAYEPFGRRLVAMPPPSTSSTAPCESTARHS